jgi:hypothetical protein
MYTNAKIYIPNRISLLFVVFLITATALSARAQNSFILRGIAFEKGSKQRIALVEIHNLRSKITVGTSDLGVFAIEAQINDTLLISKRYYLDTVMVIRNPSSLNIYLERGNTLREVTIKSQSKQKALDELRNDYKSKGVFYKGRPPVLAFIFSPLTAFYELFGKTPRQARRMENLLNAEINNQVVDRLFNKSTIQEQTGLNGKELEQFLVNYRPSYEQAVKWTRYDAIKWINDSFKKYQETQGTLK